MRADACVAEVDPDRRHPNMYRISLRDEPLSDMVNLTRAREAALRRASSRPSPASERTFNEDVTMSSKTGPANGDRDILLRKHPRLYHYTNEDGLRGIVKSNSLWATYYRNMNDANEIYELRSPLVAELVRRLTPFAQDLRRKGRRATQLFSASAEAEHFANTLARIFYSTVFDQKTTACYITSFCSHTDDQDYEREHGLLSQWRGYGGRGGYCLVLDTAALSSLFERENGSYMYAYTDLRQVHYSVEGALEARLFSELFDRSEVIAKAAMNAKVDPLVDDAVLSFVASATTLKHRGFYEEREIRLIAVAGTQAAQDIMKNVAGYKAVPLKGPFTTDRNGSSRKHITLFGSDFASLPIQRVIVGPSRSQDQNVGVAREIVGTEVLVTKSATPFIG
jgi:hypothetical protein